MRVFIVVWPDNPIDRVGVVSELLAIRECMSYVYEFSIGTQEPVARRQIHRFTSFCARILTNYFVNRL